MDDEFDDNRSKGVLSALRDGVSRATLERYMIAHGVDPYTARSAATRCEKAIVGNAAIGSAAMGLLTALATAPIAGIGGVGGVMAGAGFGAVSGLLTERCKTVRDAAFGVVQDRSFDLE